MRGSSAAAGQRQRPALTGAGRAHPPGVHAGQVHHHPRQLHRVEEHLAIKHVVGRPVEPADHVTVKRRALVAAGLLRAPALAAHVHRGHGEPLRDVAQLVQPAARIQRVAVEHQHRRAGRGLRLRPQQLGVDARAARAREPQMLAVGDGTLEVGRHKLDLGLGTALLGERPLPVVVVVLRPRVDAPQLRQFLKPCVKKQRHASFSCCRRVRGV